MKSVMPRKEKPGGRKLNEEGNVNLAFQKKKFILPHYSRLKVVQR